MALLEKSTGKSPGGKSMKFDENSVKNVEKAEIDKGVYQISCKIDDSSWFFQTEKNQTATFVTMWLNLAGQSGQKRNGTNLVMKIASKREASDEDD
jgi:hypothetical protein